jgi:hypothetical protein
MFLIKKTTKSGTILEEYLFFMNILWFIRHTHSTGRSSSASFVSCYNIDPQEKLPGSLTSELVPRFEENVPCCGLMSRHWLQEEEQHVEEEHQPSENEPVRQRVGVSQPMQPQLQHATTDTVRSTNSSNKNWLMWFLVAAIMFLVYRRLFLI